MKIINLNKKKDYVKKAIEIANSVLDLFERKITNDKRPRQAIQAAKDWLQNPTEENQQKAVKISNETRKLSSKYSGLTDVASVAMCCSQAAYIVTINNSDDPDDIDELKKWISIINSNTEAAKKSATNSPVKTRTMYY